MPLTQILDIAASALTAQSQRLNVVASNLANADSATSADGTPYRAKQVVFSSASLTPDGAAGVRVTGVIQDPTPPRQIYDPKNPLANKDG